MHRDLLPPSFTAYEIKLLHWTVLTHYLLLYGTTYCFRSFVNTTDNKNNATVACTVVYTLITK